MEESIQISSCSTSFQLEVMTNSQYYSMETDDTSDEDDTSDGRSSSDANNNDLRDTANDIDDANRIALCDHERQKTHITIWQKNVRTKKDTGH